jgi:hypothetical protein
MRHMARYVLCRPLGGLNDILCQIEKCCRHAERFGRTVVVETDFPRTIYFADAFDRYFESRDRALILSAEGIVGLLPEDDVQPAFLRGELADYRLRYHPVTQQVVHAATRLPVTFDFEVDHPEAVLVHQQTGGGLLSMGCLSRLTLARPIVDELARRCAAIGGDYAAIHVRNTDMRTRYHEAIAALAVEAPDRLFVATDNQVVLEDMVAALGRERIFSFAALAPIPGEPIHKIVLDRTRRYYRNCDAILDLLMLALARRLQVLAVDGYVYGAHSGYSLLAQALSADKDVLRRLIADPRFPCTPEPGVHA